MSIVNTIGSKSSLTPTILVTAPTGSTVTCDGTQGMESSGKWRFKVPIKQSVNPACHNLPSGFQEVEWIASPSTPYINTAYIPTINTTAKFVFSYGTSNSVARIMATRNEPGHEDNAFWFSASENRIYNYIFNYVTLKASVTANTKYSVESFTDGSVKVDDVTISHYSGTWTSGTINYPLYLFALNNGGTLLSNTDPITLYTCELYDNGTLVRNYVPCYCTESVTAYQGSTQTTASAGTIGMYDLVNDRFYINSGSGTFSKGDEVSQYIYTPYTIVATSSDQTKTKTVSVTVDAVALFQVSIDYHVPTWLQECEYIQGTGSQYINPNIQPTSNTQINCTFKSNDNSNRWRLFACSEYSPSNAKTYGFMNKWDSFGTYSASAGSETGWVEWTTTDTSVHTMVFNDTNHNLIFDDENKGTLPTSSSFSQLDLYLFAYNEDGYSPAQFFKGNVYGAFIYESGVSVRNFIPTYAKESHTAYKGSTEVTCSAGAVGLYDMVNDRFYINSGTGTDFTKGDDV